MKIAFYAPMKPPSHPVPSGDRRMARLLIQALELAGFDVELVSELRVFDKAGNPDLQAENREKGKREAERLIQAWSSDGAELPNAWFTYHLYHKAPDWIGPIVCRHFNIPYIVAEASHAPKQRMGPWRLGYEAAQRAIQEADCVFHLTTLDGACLAPLIQPAGRLVFLPPFLDMETFLQSKDPGFDVLSAIEGAGGTRGKYNLLAVAMMRSGDKMQSYTELGKSLTLSRRDDWQLLVVGDGDNRQEVEKSLSALREKAVYLGVLESGKLASVYAASDLYVWPASGEAYGMAFLEAQASGLPIVAGNVRGVPDVVINGRTGLLTEFGDSASFAANVDRLLADPARRKEMGRAARDFVRGERSMAHAVDILKSNIEAVIR